jgi:hypothetical protein
VPYYEDLGPAGVTDYWRRKNTHTIDGFQTGLFEDGFAPALGGVDISAKPGANALRIASGPGCFAKEICRCCRCPALLANTHAGKHPVFRDDLMV